jgi:hypothetical protein
MAMKNMDAMEQAPKSTDLALANDEAGGLEMPANQRRRRLVRGAAAFAPVVLTLRSGALAAASCTGAIQVDATIDNNGKPSPDAGVTKGDYCLMRPPVDACDGQPGKVKTITLQPGEYTPVDNNGKCGSFPKGTRVAIISSGNALNSFGIVPPVGIR